MEIKSAEFVISNTNVKKCPTGDLPEYAFIGRSNVGKSSLINMLTGKKGLAMTSQKPGKTLLINHFLINGQWYLVDLPGYGFAQRGKEGRENIPFSLIFTKIDKISKGRLQENLKVYQTKLLESWEELPPILLSSSEKKEGRDKILNYIDEINKSL